MGVPLIMADAAASVSQGLVWAAGAFENDRQSIIRNQI